MQYCEIYVLLYSRENWNLSNLEWREIFWFSFHLLSPFSLTHDGLLQLSNSSLASVLESCILLVVASVTWLVFLQPLQAHVSKGCQLLFTIGQSMTRLCLGRVNSDSERQGGDRITGKCVQWLQEARHFLPSQAHYLILIANMLYATFNMYKLCSFYCSFTFQFDTFVLLHIPIVVMIIVLESFTRVQYMGNSIGEVQYQRLHHSPWVMRNVSSLLWWFER